MNKFWRAWRADEIVAVYTSETNPADVSVKLRGGETGVAYSVTKAMAIREIEALLLEDRVIKDEAFGLKWEVERLKRVQAELEAQLAFTGRLANPSELQEILVAVLPVLNGERNYLRADEKDVLRRILLPTAPVASVGAKDTCDGSTEQPNRPEGGK